ncbi:MAG: protein TolR [Holosporales bacterium]
MAGGIQKRSNGSGGRFSRPVMSEINVTPLVDVMLVLLVIFMVTAPMMTVGVPVDLPKANASSINEQTEPLTISVTAKGEIYLQETPVPLEALVPRLQAITAAKPDTRIFVRGDQAIAYGKVMEVMGTLSAAGFSKVALLAELPSPAPQGAGVRSASQPAVGR